MIDQQLTDHFRLSEFTYSATAKRLGRLIEPTEEEITNLKRLCETMLEPLRLKYGQIEITSGLRPPWLNTAIGGSKSSAHMYGCAADCKFKELTPQLVLTGIKEDCKNLPYDQIILEYDSWVHIGIERVGAQRRGQLLVAEVVSGRTLYTPYTGVSV